MSRATSAVMASAACLRPGDQVGQAVGAVLGLDDQVDGGVGDRRRVVGDHDHLGGPGERRGHAHRPLAGHQPLGDGHVAVAGPDDHVDGRDASRSRRPGRAMAWAPPIRYTSSTPAIAAAASTDGADRPSGPGGEHRASSATPATRAGTAVMSTVDARGARPPGHVQPGPVDRDGRCRGRPPRRGPSARRGAAGCGGRRRCCRGRPRGRPAARPGWRRGRPSPRSAGPGGRRRRRRRTAR